MRLTALLMTVAIVNVSAKGISQNISFSGKDVSLETIFRQIENQSEYFIFYSQSALSKSKPVTVEANNETLTSFLERIFAGQPLAYTIKDKNIIVTPSRELKYPAILSTAPPIIVRGRVVNESGEGVVASVIVKGTNNASSTNDNGEFTLTGVEESATLIISGVSVETMEIKVNGKRSLGNIVVKTKVSAGEDVVIVGNTYWRVKQKENTGNISKVDAKIIDRQPVSNPLAALHGRMPGVYIQQTTGAPGGGYNIQIRGLNSLRADGNAPLFIVDGVPFPSQPITAPGLASPLIKFGNPLNSINPVDIYRIEVLKDADATAIYGSRGANGVVVITTKKGKAGKTKFDLSVYQGAGKVTNMMDLLNTQQYLEMRNEALANDGVTPTLSNTRHVDVLTWGNRYTDWQKLLIGGTAHNTRAQMSISGGDSKTKFLISGAFYRESTVVPGDFSYQKGSVNFSLNHTSSNQKFTIDVATTYTIDKNSIPSNDPTIIALKKAPNAPALVNADGSFNWDDPTFNNNPLADMSRTYDLKTNNFLTSASFGYRIIPGLIAKTRFGYNSLAMEDIRLYPVRTSSPSLGAVSGSSDFSNGTFTSWVIEPQLEYNKNIYNGNLTMFIGTSFQGTLHQRETRRASGFVDDNSLDNIHAAATIINVENTYHEYRHTAIFGRFNYNWKMRYIVNLTGRRDGSSRFGPGKRFGNFGAIGMAWIFSNETFVKNNLCFLSFGKLRASYGITGSDQIPDYEYLNTYQYSGDQYLGIPNLLPARIANPEFSWEENKKWEGSLELGFLKDRISFAVSYYRNRSSNQLVGFNIPNITGFSSITSNFPATVQNTGWEFETNARIVAKKSISWETSINLTIPRNKLVSFPNIANSAYASTYEVGNSLFVRRVYDNGIVNPLTGIYEFADKNVDGVINANDRVFNKSGAQDFYGGFQNVVTYKGFEIDIFLQFVKQNGQSYMRHFSMAPGFLSNQPVEVLNRWRKPGDNTNVQKFTQQNGGTSTGYQNSYLYGDNLIVDASFARLRNLSVSWNFPRSWLAKAKIANMRIFLQGQNLLTFTNYVGLDPENSIYSVSIPPLKMLTAGVQITF